MRIWVHKARRVDAVPDEMIRVVLGQDNEGLLRSAQEAMRCRECIADFIADDDSLETVTFTFDAGARVYRFESKTDSNGLVENDFEVPGDYSGWLTVTAEVKKRGEVHTGTGRVRLLEPNGNSVVSDIDDTIKVSEIPAGGRIILRNTFLRDYVVAEGMLDRYRRVSSTRLGQPVATVPAAAHVRRERNRPRRDARAAVSRAPST